MNYLGFPYWETIARLDQTIIKGQATKKVILKFSLTVSKSRNLGIVQASTLFILKDNGLSAVSFLKKHRKYMIEEEWETICGILIWKR